MAIEENGRELRAAKLKGIRGMVASLRPGDAATLREGPGSLRVEFDSEGNVSVRSMNGKNLVIIPRAGNWVDIMEASPE